MKRHQDQHQGEGMSESSPVSKAGELPDTVLRHVDELTGTFGEEHRNHIDTVIRSVFYAGCEVGVRLSRHRLKLQRQKRAKE
jgi:hypothetical protein